MASLMDLSGNGGIEDLAMKDQDETPQGCHEKDRLLRAEDETPEDSQEEKKCPLTNTEKEKKEGLWKSCRAVVAVSGAFVLLMVSPTISCAFLLALVVTCNNGIDGHNASNSSVEAKEYDLPIAPDAVFSKLVFATYIVTTVLRLSQYISLPISCYRNKSKAKNHASCLWKALVPSFFMIYLIVTTVSWVFEFLADIQYAHECESHTARSFALASASFNVLERLVEVLVRAGMLYAAINVYLCFKEVHNDRFETNITSKYAVELEYDKIAQNVIPFLRMFEPWFFFTWFLYTITTMSSLTIILRDLIVISSNFRFSKIYSRTEDLFLCFNAAYNLCSFVTPYLFAMWMNYSHQKAYERLLQINKKHSNSERTQNTEVVSAAQLHSNLKKNKQCDFLPHVCTVALEIGSIQYFLPILFPTIALIWSFVVRRV